MKKLLLLFILTLVMAFVVACNSESSSDDTTKDTKEENTTDTEDSEEDTEAAEEDVTLRVAWWGGGQERHDRTLQVIEMYEEQNPHVTIEAEYSGFDGYFDKLNTQLAAGNAPDVIQFGGNLNDFVLRDVILPLDDYAGNELDTSLHSQSMLDSATFDGKLYGVTLGTTAWGVLVNKTAIEEAGVTMPSKEWTWEDFKEITPQITENMDGMYGTSDFNEDGFGVFLAQRDKYTYLDGKIGFGAEDVKDWFNLWKELRESGGAAIPEVQVSASQTPEQSLIVQRDVAIESIASNQLGAYAGATEDEFELYPYPYNAETGKNGISLRPSQYFAAYKDTPHPEEAAKFMDFFVNNTEATEILGNDRGAPVNSEVRQNLIDQASELDEKVYSYIDLVSETSDAPYIPNLPGYNENTQLFTETAQIIYYDQKTVEEAAEDYFEELLSNIEKYASEAE
ncbi:rhamnose oligosaccharide ABC transport system [Gracilibacillus boraciitolerans JCM 21714]|uniref:Rhamnose oligosaccharide ABC transport system n=1 Tax=Gracilibacillus boraciitolerans JCM 21714 TaxID=1298598 RepID=W4VJX2_9BACI|nr:extracellular solute-binding protein [Gracilibacillus boraciitolerans]GAE93436.1 rhamnose oligosaccharide ABC transport system [Gracilibacillus boraciitolerans JCM 21714]